MKRRRAKPLSKRALDVWANSAAHAVPVLDLVRQAEREAEQQARDLAEVSRPLGDRVSDLARRWGARVVAS